METNELLEYPTDAPVGLFGLVLADESPVAVDSDPVAVETEGGSHD
jgi:hypothetical protein